MDFADGMPLSELLGKREEQGRPFDEAELLAVMVPLLDGLKRVHATGALHRHIKPSNILIPRAVQDERDRPVLIDFGAAKQSFGQRTKSFAPFTQGYATIEQVGGGEVGPWTDIYSVGAVMWRIVAGGSASCRDPDPVRVEFRASSYAAADSDPLRPAREIGAGRFSDRVLAAIDRCLAYSKSERIQSCDELLRLLGQLGQVPQRQTRTWQARQAIPPHLVGSSAPDTSRGVAGSRVPDTKPPVARRAVYGFSAFSFLALIVTLASVGLSPDDPSPVAEVAGGFSVSVEPADAIVTLLNTQEP